MSAEPRPSRPETAFPSDELLRAYKLQAFTDCKDELIRWTKARYRYVALAGVVLGFFGISVFLDYAVATRFEREFGPFRQKIIDHSIAAVVAQQRMQEAAHQSHEAQKEIRFLDAKLKALSDDLEVTQARLMSVDRTSREVIPYYVLCTVRLFFLPEHVELAKRARVELVRNGFRPTLYKLQEDGTTEPPSSRLSHHAYPGKETSPTIYGYGSENFECTRFIISSLQAAGVDVGDTSMTDDIDEYRSEMLYEIYVFPDE